MPRRPESELLTKERTVEVLKVLRAQGVTMLEIAKHCKVQPNSPYQWSCGKSRAPKELEGMLNEA